MLSVSTTTTTSGPLWNGGFDRALDAYTNQAADDIAQVGLQMMHGTARFFRRPTGRWENALVVDGVGDDRVIHNDLVYNAWLAGEGSRNFPVTRFRGYRMWRLTQQNLDAVAVPIAVRTLQRFIGRMG